MDTKTLPFWEKGRLIIYANGDQINNVPAFFDNMTSIFGRLSYDFDGANLMIFERFNKEISVYQT